MNCSLQNESLAQRRRDDLYSQGKPRRGSQRNIGDRKRDEGNELDNQSDVWAVRNCLATKLGKRGSDWPGDAGSSQGDEYVPRREQMSCLIAEPASKTLRFHVPRCRKTAARNQAFSKWRVGQIRRIARSIQLSFATFDPMVTKALARTRSACASSVNSINGSAIAAMRERGRATTDFCASSSSSPSSVP